MTPAPPQLLPTGRQGEARARWRGSPVHTPLPAALLSACLSFMAVKQRCLRWGCPLPREAPREAAPVGERVLGASRAQVLIRNSLNTGEDNERLRLLEELGEGADGRPGHRGRPGEQGQH